jgi:CRP/FNR family transcriptional regulator, anaerobic regulatory protein
MADWLAEFPALARLEPVWARRLRGAATAFALPAGAPLFAPGQPCTHFVFVRAGRVRVHQLGADGGELVLYRLGAGQICILTTASLLGAADYGAFATVEAPVAATAVPARTFHDAMGGSAIFRGFVFAAHAARMSELLRVIQHVAFDSIESRLAARLLLLAGEGGRVAITHQQLAAEIGTAREVVSRQLKSFEGRGWVTLARGTVALRRPQALRTAARPAV